MNAFKLGFAFAIGMLFGEKSVALDKKDANGMEHLPEGAKNGTGGQFTNEETAERVEQELKEKKKGSVEQKQDKPKEKEPNLTFRKEGDKVIKVRKKDNIRHNLPENKKFPNKKLDVVKLGDLLKTFKDEITPENVYKKAKELVQLLNGFISYGEGKNEKRFFFGIDYLREHRKHLSKSKVGVQRLKDIIDFIPHLEEVAKHMEERPWIQVEGHPDSDIKTVVIKYENEDGRKMKGVVCLARKRGDVNGKTSLHDMVSHKRSNNNARQARDGFDAPFYEIVDIRLESL